MPGITASNYREIGKGKVVASVDVVIEAWHFKITCLVIDGSNGPFLSLPSKSFKAREGKTVYQPLVEITDKDVARRFEESALEAVKAIATSAATVEKERALGDFAAGVDWPPWENGRTTPG